MSLSDHLRYLRARQGGTHTLEIAAALELPTPTTINLAETQYRPVRDEALVAKLATYYERPLEEFQWHNARPRKYLTFYIARALKTKEIVSLTLRSGRQLTGTAEWWDLGSIGLRGEDGRLTVVQRHAVVDWPGAATEWQDV
jgi:biotin-(acetyl-CoA carboxylase) ligase